LSWLGIQLSAAAKRREAIQKILEHGGHVQYPENDPFRIKVPPSPLTLRGMLGDEYLGNVFDVDLDESLTDARLRELLPYLKRLGGKEGLLLGLDRTAITDSGLKSLAESISLTGLSLMSTSVSDKGIVHIATMKDLRYLNLGDSPVTDEGVRHIAIMEDLCYLNLVGTPVTDASLPLLRNLPKLRNLDLHVGDGITRDGIESLRSSMPRCHVE
jgi:hypothetical protein